jgi:phage tail-like protein
MANPGLETVSHPFTAFSFAVEIAVSLGPLELLPHVCNASFSECDGLEATMDVRTLREGGNNATQIKLAGPLNYGQVTLKRGMSPNLDLWDWMTLTCRDPAARGDGQVVVLAPDGSERVRFLLSRCLPVKVKAPPLNAKDGMVAIEELQLAYESLTVRRPGGGIGV